LDAAIGRGNGVPVRVSVRVAQIIGYPGDQKLGDRMFQDLGLLMDLVPGVVQYLNQKCFNQSMTTHHVHRMSTPGSGQGNRTVWRVVDEPGTPQPTQSVRRRR